MRSLSQVLLLLLLPPAPSPPLLSHFVSFYFSSPFKFSFFSFFSSSSLLHSSSLSSSHLLLLLTFHLFLPLPLYFLVLIFSVLLQPCLLLLIISVPAYPFSSFLLILLRLFLPLLAFHPSKSYSSFPPSFSFGSSYLLISPIPDLSSFCPNSASRESFVNML